MGFGGFQDSPRDSWWRKRLRKVLVFLAFHPVLFWVLWCLWIIPMLVLFVIGTVSSVFWCVIGMALAMVAMALYTPYRVIARQLRRHHGEVPKDWFKA